MDKYAVYESFLKVQSFIANMEEKLGMSCEENVEEGFKNTQRIEGFKDFDVLEDVIAQKKKCALENDNGTESDHDTSHKINPEPSPISRVEELNVSKHKKSEYHDENKDSQDQNANIEETSEYQKNVREKVNEVTGHKETKEDEELVSSIGKRKFTIKFELPLNNLLNKEKYSSHHKDSEGISDKNSPLESTKSNFDQSVGEWEENVKESHYCVETIQSADEDDEREDYHYNNLEDNCNSPVGTCSDDENRDNKREDYTYNNLEDNSSKAPMEASREDENRQFTNEDDVVYCICRSSDISRFMIGCDSCEEWYHGDCIDITEESAAAIRKFYCTFCLAENPELEVVYKRKKPVTPNKPQETHDINLNVQHMVKKKNDKLNRIFHVDKENNKVINKKSKSKKLVTKSKSITDFRKKKKVSKSPHNKILKKHVMKKTMKIENEITDEGEDSISSTRLCLGPECTKSPRPMSRYCSEECGLRLAEELYAEIAGANKQVAETNDDYPFSDTFSVLFDQEQSGNINKGMKKVSKKVHFKCPVCDRRYSSQRTLKTHMLNHSGQKPIACTQCHFKTTKKDILNRHMLTHTGEKPFKCSLCNFRCAQNGILKRHLLTHTNEKPFGCTTCDYRCKLKGHLKAHMLTHTNVKMFACSECDYRSKTQGGLKAHMLTHTGEKPYSCQECSFKCAQKSHLNRHMLTHKSEKPFKCLQCDYRCALKHHLKSHMLNHTNEKSFACTYCEYRSKTQWSLKEHLMIHTGDYPFECFDCDYRCSKASVFKQHLLTHTDEKPFSCSICDLKFKRKDNLKAHMTIHTGDKAFSCPECGMNFKQSSYLKKHMLTHIGYKPLVCSVCSMRFTHTAALQKHILTHEGEQTFSCTECNFETTEKDKIKFHMLSHAGNPFACIKCEFKCRKSNLFNSDMASHVAVS